MAEGHTIETYGHTIAGRRSFVTPSRFFCLSFNWQYTHYCCVHLIRVSTERALSGGREQHEEGQWTTGGREQDAEGQWTTGGREQHEEGQWTTGGREQDAEGQWTTGGKEEDEERKSWTTGGKEQEEEGQRTT